MVQQKPDNFGRATSAGPGCRDVVLTLVPCLQTRWYSFHFLVQQLVGALVRLRISLNLALPLLPGADIQDVVYCSGGTPHEEGCKDECPKGLAIGAEGHKKRPADVQIAVE